MKLSPDRGTIVAQARLWAGDDVPDAITFIDTATGKIRHSAYPRKFSGRIDWAGNEHLWLSRLNPARREFELVVVRSEQTRKIAASLRWRNGKVSATGDQRLFEHVPEYHITPMITHGRGGRGSIHALRLHPGRDSHSYQFPWFTNETYDLDYQGLVDVAPHPFRNEALVSVQRAGHFVVFDPMTGRKLRIIELAGRSGNASFNFDPDGTVWTVDYDTLVHLDLRDERVINRARLQGDVPSEHSPSSTMRTWIGEIWPDHESGLIWVARTFSGDVVAVRKSDLQILHRIEPGGAPFHAIAANGHLFTQEWGVSDINIRTL